MEATNHSKIKTLLEAHPELKATTVLSWGFPESRNPVSLQRKRFYLDEMLKDEEYDKIIEGLKVLKEDIEKIIQ